MGFRAGSAHLTDRQARAASHRRPRTRTEGAWSANSAGTCGTGGRSGAASCASSVPHTQRKSAVVDVNSAFSVRRSAFQQERADHHMDESRAMLTQRRAQRTSDAVYGGAAAVASRGASIYALDDDPRAVHSAAGVTTEPFTESEAPAASAAAAATTGSEPRATSTRSSAMADLEGIWFRELRPARIARGPCRLLSAEDAELPQILEVRMELDAYSLLEPPVVVDAECVSAAVQAVSEGIVRSASAVKLLAPAVQVAPNRMRTTADQDVAAAALATTVATVDADDAPSTPAVDMWYVRHRILRSIYVFMVFLGTLPTAEPDELPDRAQWHTYLFVTAEALRGEQTPSVQIQPRKRKRAPRRA